jgi:hypothetical protein
MDADNRQFAVLFPKLKSLGEAGVSWLQEEVAKQSSPDANDDVKEKMAKRQANAAVALFLMGRPDKVWPLLKHSPDPTVRSYLIDRIGPRGADAGAIVEQLQDERDVTIRRALILSLGEFGENDSPEMRCYPDPTCPIGGVNWYDAAAYCNWLSKQEDIPQDQWCYEINLAEQASLKENYLSLTGYRLPTEAEWEYACRAGALTSRSYGESEELLGKYGWYFQNSEERTWPVGSKKPNDLGLFDMHGNVWNWCQESYKSYPQGDEGKTFDDIEDLRSATQDDRVMRGGSFGNPASIARSSYRVGIVPAFRNFYVGIRLAKTFASD